MAFCRLDYPNTNHSTILRLEHLLELPARYGGQRVVAATDMLTSNEDVRDSPLAVVVGGRGTTEHDG